MPFQLMKDFIGILYFLKTVCEAAEPPYGESIHENEDSNRGKKSWEMERDGVLILTWEPATAGGFSFS